MEEQLSPALVGRGEVGRRRDRTGNRVDVEIEPQPVTQKPMREASKRACSPARRRSPRR